MKKRFWYALEKSTNPIGMGCWQIAGNHTINGKPNGWGIVSEKEALKVLGHALEIGIDFFDTAQGYNNGISEKLLGQAIKTNNTTPVVCTKIVLSENDIIKRKLGNNFLERIERSFDNLALSKIDILLIHNPPDDLDWKNFDYCILNDLVKNKSIGTYGVSSRSLKGAKLALEQDFGSVIEWVFNLFERRPLEEIFPLLEKRKVNFIARSPLSRGLINPTYLWNEPIFGDNDFRSTLPKEWVQWTINNLKILKNKGIKEEELIQLALSFCVSNLLVSSTIVGVRTLKQIQDLKEILSYLNEKPFFDKKTLDGLPVFYPPWQ